MPVGTRAEAPRRGRKKDLTEFCMDLAGMRIGVRALYPQSRAYCRDYLCQGSPELLVEIRPELLEQEQARSRSSALEEGLTPWEAPAEYLELRAIYRQIAEQAPARNVLLFHGSAIAVDGQTYLFTAKSGTGKSTHTRLWRQRFGDRALMVNDDKPLLRFTPEGVLACGTPWDGKHRLSTPIQLPLKAVCVLTRDDHNHIEALPAREAYPTLYQQSYPPRDPEAMALTLSLLGRLTQQVKLYHLGCNMDPSAAEISYNGMQEEDK